MLESVYGVLVREDVLGEGSSGCSRFLPGYGVATYPARETEGMEAAWLGKPTQTEVRMLEDSRKRAASFYETERRLKHEGPGQLGPV